VEYEKNEVRDLLALEIPKRKKKKIKEKENSKVQCFKCKELGHYADKCPERDNKANRQRGTAGHLSKMQQKGALCKEMRREKHFKTSENGITKDAANTRKIHNKE
jgi:hypothetical protein